MEPRRAVEMPMMKRELLTQLLREAYGPAEFSVRNIADELRKILRNDPDPMRAERAVGTLYGSVFKRREAALNPWTPPDLYEDDNAPYVCPGCYAIGDDPHAGYCPDASIEFRRQLDDDRDSGDELDDSDDD
jgi:hypothetical protein